MNGDNTSYELLLVEDNPRDVDLFREYLGQERPNPHNLRQSASLSDALDLLNKHPFDLVILDLNLEDSSGLDTYKSLRSQVTDVPVVILTGQKDEALAKQALEIGAQEYLLKDEINTHWLNRAIQYTVERFEFNRQVQESEQQFRTMPETIEEGFWITDQDYNRFQYTNEAFDRMFQLEGENPEAKLEEFSEGIHPEDKQKTNSMVDTLTSGGKVNEEYRYVLPDGSVRWIWVKALATGDREKSSRRIVGTNNDITERKQATLDLKERNKEQRCLRNILELSEMESDSEEDFIKQVVPQIPPGYQSPDRTHVRIQMNNYTVASSGFVETNCKQTVPLNIEDEQVGTIEVYGEQQQVTRDKFFLEKEKTLLESIGSEVSSKLGKRRARQELLESEKRFQQIARNTDEVFWLSTVDKDMIYVSPAFEEIWGIPPEAIMADLDAFFERIHPDDRERIREAVYNRQVSGEYDEEYRIIRPDGEIRWVHDQVKPVRDESGVVVRLAGVAKDITDRKQAEKELRETAGRLDLATDAAGAGIWEWNVEDDSFFWNEKTKSIFGSETEPDTLRDFKQLIHPADFAKTESKLHETVEKGTTYRNEFRIERPDTGEVRWIEVRAERSGGGDSARKLVGTAMDMTERKQREQELIRFREAVEASGFSVYMTDLDGNITYANSAFEDLTGYSFDDVKGRNPRFLNSGEQDEAFYEDLWGTILDGNNWQGELVDEKKSGEHYTALQTIAPVQNNQGEIDRFIAIQQDITERHRTREALEESEQRFRQMAESVGEAFWLMTADRSEVLYVNPAFEDIFGRDTQKLIDNPDNFIEYIHPDDRDKLLEEQKHISCENPEQGPGVDLKIRIQLPDGEIRWILHREYPVYDNGGKLIRIAGVNKDVTPYHRTQLRERQTRNRLEQMADNIEDVFYLLNSDYSETLYISPAFEEIWGYPVAAEYEDAWNFADAILEEDQEDVLETKQEWLENPEETSSVTEYRIRNKSGEIRWIRDEMFPVRDDNGTLDRVAGTARDVTEQRKLRNQLEDSLEKSQVLLQEVHHRVKNNLQIVLGLLGLQGRRLEDSEATEAIEQSKQRIHSMALIHRKLYESDDLSEVNFRSYVKDLVEHLVQVHTNSVAGPELELEIESHNIELDTIIPCGLIINELVTNSLKHAFPGENSGLITVQFTKLDTDFCITVADDGVGATGDDPAEGSSLGMNLVQNLTENQLHGELSTSVEDGFKTEIWFPSEANQ